MKWRRILAALAAAVLGAAGLHTALHSLGPDSAYILRFNSDHGIPLLMIHEPGWDLFRAYYFGQDRFGAWPFFVIHLFAPDCKPALLSAILGAFVVSGIVPAFLLADVWGAIAWLVAIFWRDAMTTLFDTAQPYGWQVVAVLWAVWAIRRVAAGGVRHVPLAAFLSFLASWISPVSGPMLVLAALVERLSIRTLVPPLLGIAGELALRDAYHRSAFRRFHNEFRTDLSIDWGNLGLHARTVFHRMSAADVSLALLVLVAASAWCVLRKCRGEERTIPGALVLALAPVPLLLSLAHVRGGMFLDRYYAPTFTFARWGALLSIGLATRSIPRVWVRRAAAAAAAVAGVVLFDRVLPQPFPTADLARMTDAARFLAARAPGSVLIDDYWGTYVYAALAPHGALRPLVREGDYDRMPFVIDELPRAARVVVGHREQPREPVTWLYQYGTLLEPVQPELHSKGAERFSLYRPIDSRPIDAGVPVELSTRPVELNVRVQQPPGGALVIGHRCERLEPPPAIEPPAQLLTLPRVLIVVPPPERPVRRLKLKFPVMPCALNFARWVTRWNGAAETISAPVPPP